MRLKLPTFIGSLLILFTVLIRPIEASDAVVSQPVPAGEEVGKKDGQKAVGDEKTVQLCPRYTLVGQDKIELKESERLLVCGDPKNPAWNNIPDNQAIFSLKTFLQARGYNNPKFETRDGKIVINIGAPTRVTEFVTKGDDPGFDIHRLRHVVGEILTPSLLDEVKTRLRNHLQGNGFGCPDVEMEASSTTGEMVAHLKTGPKQNLIKVNRDPIAGMNSEVLSRYDAFELNHIYNNDYLTVAVNRLLDVGLVQSAYFTTQCQPDGAVVTEHFVPGPARQISFGFGVDTEHIILVRAGWKNSRLGNTSSLISLAALLSITEQSFNADFSWFILPQPSRFYLRPAFQFQHQDLRAYESFTSQISFTPAGTMDTHDLALSYYFGPTLNLTRTVRGKGPSFAKFMSLAGQLRFTDHYYEFYRSSPRQGFDLRMEGNFAEDNWLSNVTANMVRIGFEKLWNVKWYDPPTVVLGLRGRLGTTITPESTSSDRLPTPFRHFLGGSTDMRGFSLQELPGPGGGETVAYLGVETRFNDLLPFNLQPFVFLDGSYFGSKAFSLDGPVFYSPGFGIRWQSQFGVVRTTLSHGYIAKQAGVSSNLAHWQFYFSFGEEF